MKRGKYYSPPANGPYGAPKGNPVMKAKRVTGASANTEMVTRIRVQEERMGGSFVFNSRTGKRKLLSAFAEERKVGTISSMADVGAQKHYH